MPEQVLKIQSDKN